MLVLSEANQWHLRAEMALVFVVPLFRNMLCASLVLVVVRRMYRVPGTVDTGEVGSTTSSG